MDVDRAKQWLFPAWWKEKTCYNCSKKGHISLACKEPSVMVFLDYSFSFPLCLYLFVYPICYVLFVLRTFTLITLPPVIYPSIGSSCLVLGLCKAVYLPSKAVLTTLVLLSHCSALPLPYTHKQQ